MPWLNLAAWLPCTGVEGPGRRAALWVQGCDKRCAGCCNPGHLPLVEREIVGADAVVDNLIRARDEFDLEGVTFLGGEPFLQARGLAAVAEGAQRAGLSVMVFSGHTLCELRARSLPGTEQLLQFTDVLVDGPYDRNLPDVARNWVGSSNQRFHYLSSRYDPSIETSGAVARGIEWRIRSDGSISVNGWPCTIGRE